MPSSLDDQKRLESLKNTELMDLPAEPAFDRITNLVRRRLGVDAALISLVDAERQFFKSESGLPSPWREARETPLSYSFCQHVVTSEAPLIVGDAANHPTVCANLAVRDLNVAAYLGVPIRGPNGDVLGALCVIKTKPTEWSDGDLAELSDFAGIVEDQIALREFARDAGRLAKENEILAHEYHHRVKNVFAVAQSLLRLSVRESTSADDAMSIAEDRFKSLADAHDALSDGGADVDLKNLLRRLLAPYQTRGRDDFTIAGPDVPLQYKQITPMCLIVHELATNSAKHGAVRDGGAVSLTWDTQNGEVVMAWIESGASRPRRRQQKSGVRNETLAYGGGPAGWCDRRRGDNGRPFR